jgi:succinate-semialdehyde dehydrogenase/glutarate-semialdehyde dehydrogenase
MSIQTTNPATNKVVKSFDEMTNKQVDHAIAQSVNAFQDWKKTSYPKRAAVLNKVASLMREKKTALATLITLEMGKILSQAEGEVELSANMEYYGLLTSELVGIRWANRSFVGVFNTASGVMGPNVMDTILCTPP